MGIECPTPAEDTFCKKTPNLILPVFQVISKSVGSFLPKFV
jgi:hypothetical protein